jgi:membrane-associated phospholipid phosphatase
MPGGWETRLLYRIAGEPPEHPGLVKAITALGSRPAAYTITACAALALASRPPNPSTFVRAHSSASRPRSSSAVVRALGTLAAGDLAREALCRTVARPRPPRELQHGHCSGFSFPSRHTTLATLAALTVIAATPASARCRVIAGSATACLAVGASRLRLGVHYPTDVAAGYLFAAAVALAADALKILPTHARNAA